MCLFLSADYTSYTYVVSTSSESWDINKRFSEFIKLDDLLNRKYADQMLKVPPMPPKKAIGALSPSLIAHRKKLLEGYLKSVLESQVIAQSEEMADFLEIPREVLNGHAPT